MRASHLWHLRAVDALPFFCEKNIRQQSPWIFFLGDIERRVSLATSSPFLPTHFFSSSFTSSPHFHCSSAQFVWWNWQAHFSQLPPCHVISKWVQERDLSSPSISGLVSSHSWVPGSMISCRREEYLKYLLTIKCKTIEKSLFYRPHNNLVF